MKRFFALLLALVMILALTACGEKETTSTPDTTTPENTTYTIRYSHVQGVSSPTHQAAEWLKTWLAENSNGQIVLEIYPSGQLYDDSTEIDAVIAGNVEMISTQLSKLTSLSPDVASSIVPYLFTSAEDMQGFYADEDVRKLIFQKFEETGIKVLGTCYSGDMYLWTNNGVAIEKMEDLKGLQMRETASAMTSAMYEALGANLVSISYSELYTGMQTKLADACTTTIDGVTGIQLQEVLTNVSNIKHQFVPFLIQFNKATFESYPEDIQALIREGIAKAGEYQLELVKQVATEGLKICEDSGVVYNEMSDAEIARLKELWDGVCEEYIADNWKQALEIYRAK